MGGTCTATGQRRDRWIWRARFVDVQPNEARQADRYREPSNNWPNAKATQGVLDFFGIAFIPRIVAEAEAVGCVKRTRAKAPVEIRRNRERASARSTL